MNYDTVKTETPARNTLLRPNRSAARQDRSNRHAYVMRYELTTHVRSAWLKCRPRWIEGNATFTIVESRTIISWPKQTTTRASQRLRSLTGGRVADLWIFIMPPLTNLPTWRSL